MAIQDVQLGVGDTVNRPRDTVPTNLLTVMGHAMMTT